MKGCKKKYWAFGVIGVVLVTLAGVLYPLGDELVREQVKKKVIIANSSDSQQFEIWEDNPVPLYQQFFMFNVENPHEVLQGRKPALTEHGPYTYREYRTKYDIVWNEDGTVSYKQNRTFYFVPEMSVGPDSDQMYTLNPLLAALAQTLKTLPQTFKSVISLVLSLVGNNDAFIQKTVRELIWGYDDSSLMALNKLLPQWFNETKVGYFIRRNYTDDGVYTVGTGEKDTDDICMIHEYNGNKSQTVWTTPIANMANGTDGSCGPPFIFNVDKKQTFQSDICRSLDLFYHKDVESPQGIPLRRYVADRINFDNVTVNPDNLGFCTPQTKCLPSGLLNASLCEKPVDAVPVPVVISWPHFLWADPDVQQSVIGLHPNAEEHQSAVDVEPWTGFYMRINKRIQVNFFVESVPGLRQLENISKLYFPIMWFNETIVVDNEHADLVKDELLLPLDILLGVKIGFFSLGGLLLLAGVGLCWRNRRRLDQAGRQDDRSSLLNGKEKAPDHSYATNGAANTQHQPS